MGMTLVRKGLLRPVGTLVAWFALNSSIFAQLNLELAKSHTEQVRPLDIVVETRVTQLNQSRYASIIVYTEDHYLLKKMDDPLLVMDKIPFDKVKETRGTLAEVMVVLAEYGLGGGQPVEFKVDFELYGAEFKLTQKGLVHPQAEMERLNRLERALNRLSAAEARVKTASPEEKTEAEVTLIRAKREINLLKRSIGIPIQDHEILYTHQKSMLFFNALMSGLDRAEGVAKLLDQSVIQQINSIKGIRSIPRPGGSPINVQIQSGNR